MWKKVRGEKVVRSKDGASASPSPGLRARRLDRGAFPVAAAVLAKDSSPWKGNASCARLLPLVVA
jgi:hypothetical protein